MLLISCFVTHFSFALNMPLFAYMQAAVSIKYLVTWFTGILSARVIVQYTNCRREDIGHIINKDHQQRSSTKIINKDHQQRSSTKIINKDHQQPLYETTINNPASKTIKDHQQPCIKPQSTTLYKTTINNPV
jgi:hypothetical protein